MKKVNYERIIPTFVGPKLAYHGFKYDDADSYPAQGQFTFSPKYWGTIQRVSIGPVQYDLDNMVASESRNNDFPTEVPKELLLNQEDSEFRMWLSNKYLLAVLESEHRSLTLHPDGGIFLQPETPPAENMLTWLRSGRVPEPGERLPDWWEFHGEADLRRVLSEIVRIAVDDGLEWFELMVADIRRYHEKLDRRRLELRANSHKEQGDRG